LIYGDERMMDEAMGNASEAAQAEAMKAWYDYTDWLVEKGWMRGGDALQPTAAATSVRAPGGEVVVTDGPFAETKEQLGGYYLIETANLDEAIEAASRCPGAFAGTIEVRPIAELPERPDAG
jgi:hypothetical protein